MRQEQLHVLAPLRVTSCLQLEALESPKAITFNNVNLIYHLTSSSPYKICPTGINSVTCQDGFRSAICQIPITASIAAHLYHHESSSFKTIPANINKELTRCDQRAQDGASLQVSRTSGGRYPESEWRELVITATKITRTKTKCSWTGRKQTFDTKG